jgi:hypothetical protein
MLPIRSLMAFCSARVDLSIEMPAAYKCCALIRSASDLPNFFASTKFFACLDLLESQELFEATQMVNALRKRQHCYKLHFSCTLLWKSR